MLENFICFAWCIFNNNKKKLIDSETSSAVALEGEIFILSSMESGSILWYAKT